MGYFFDLRRPSAQLEKLVKGANQKMLIQQLKQLEKDGIVSRTVYPQVPPRVEYKLSEMGVALGPSMQALIEWAEMRRSVRGEAIDGAHMPSSS